MVAQKRKIEGTLKRIGKYVKRAAEVANVINAVTGTGTADNADADDGIINPVAPVETTRTRSTLTKRQKKSYKKKKNFAKKVQNALAGKKPINIWNEQLAFANTQVMIYTGGLANDTNHQNVHPYTGSFHGWSMMHPGNLTTGYTGGYALYPHAALLRLTGDADTVQTTSGGHRGNHDAKKIRTTHCRMSATIKNISESNALFVDIYMFVAAEDIVNVNMRSPGEAWVTCVSTAGAGTSMVWDLPPYNAAINVFSRGVQPLDAPEFGKHWKQEGKIRMEIQPEQIIEWKHPSLRRVSATHSEFANKYAVKHKTQAIMFVVQSTNQNIGLLQNLINIEVNKQYHWEMADEMGAAGVLAPVLTNILY